jgi:AbrB family looped-hinge helix DNA binding protein
MAIVLLMTGASYMNSVTVKVGPGGRIVIPAEIRSRLDLKPGDSVVISETGGEIVISTLESRIRKAQALIRQYVPAGVNLADELIAERRAEAERE